MNSRLPLPRPGQQCPVGLLPAPQQSPLNMAAITAKLAASERDADAARVRAKIKAARLGGGGNKGSAGAVVNLPPPLGPSSSSVDMEPAGDGPNHAGVMSTRSFESDSAAGSGASTSASASDGAPSSTTTATTGVERDEEADELAFSPPVARQQQASERQRKREVPTQQGKVAVGAVPAGRKRERRTSKTASRRRSTLNSWELDALIQGGTVAVER